MKRCWKYFLSGLEINIYCIKTEPIFTSSMGNVAKGKHIMVRRLWAVKKKKIPVSNKCSLSVPHQRLIFLTSPFYEQLMHLLPNMGKTQLRRMPLVQSFIYQCFSVFGGWICWRFSRKTSLFKAKNTVPSQNTVDIFALWCYAMSWLNTLFSNQPRGGEARTLTGGEYLFTQWELVAPSCKLNNSTECSLERD